MKSTRWSLLGGVCTVESARWSLHGGVCTVGSIYLHGGVESTHWILFPQCFPFSIFLPLNFLSSPLNVLPSQSVPLSIFFPLNGFPSKSLSSQCPPLHMASSPFFKPQYLSLELAQRLCYLIGYYWYFSFLPSFLDFE